MVNRPLAPGTGVARAGRDVNGLDRDAGEGALVRLHGHDALKVAGGLLAERGRGRKKEGRDRDEGERKSETGTQFHLVTSLLKFENERKENNTQTCSRL